MPVRQALDHVRADRVIEHRRRADLHRAAAEQEVVQRVARTRRCRRCRRTTCRETPASAAPSSPATAAESPGRRGRRSTRSPSTFISNSSVSGSISGSDGNVFDDVIASAPPRNAPLRLDDDVGRRGRELRPDRHRRDFLHDLGDDRDQLLILADVRAHVLAVHVRARQVQLERVRALVLAGLRERLPVRELLVAARAGHDRRDQDARRDAPS